jgi:multicomponent Na+:H+ antiporter subunit D
MTISIAGPGFLLLPGLVMMICGLVLLPLRGAARTGVVIAGPLAVLALVWWLPEGPSQPVPWLGYQLVPFNSDALARLFASAFAAVALAGGLFALRQERRAEIPVAYLYAGGAIGVAFAADFLTLFVFWEAMAVLAAVIVWMGGPKARGAGQRYIVVHLLGGVLLMAGIAGHVAATGSIAIGPMALDSPAAWLILAGFLVNTATWPISAWLPDAYPAASWSGTVFLSAFTTKAAVLVLIRTFAGADILVVAGLVTIAYASLYAARESNIRRLVAYALVAQLGFMLTATGVGSDLAINGAAAHAVAGIVYQALLFMGASAVFYITGKEDCGDLGGLYRAMPVTTVCTLVGALSIAAFPLTSGYVAKVMISDSVAASGGAIAWFVVTAGSAAAVLHAGWRLPWSVFFGRDAGLEASDPPASMRWAMVLLAVVSVALGIFPTAFYSLLPTAGGEEPYSAGHVVAQVQLLVFAGLGFMVLRRWLSPVHTTTLDVDWLWRRLGPRVYRLLDGGSARARETIVHRGYQGAEQIVRTVYRHHGPQGVLARAWPTGSMALWAVFLLGAYLVFYYL